MEQPEQLIPLILELLIKWGCAAHSHSSSSPGLGRNGLRPSVGAQVRNEPALGTILARSLRMDSIRWIECRVTTWDAPNKGPRRRL